MRLVCLALAVALSQVASERGRGPTVDFIAVQPDGTPVPDLRAADVEIRIGDRVRTVRSLRRVTAAPAPAGSRIPPPYGTNDNVSSGRRFILIVDQESLQAGRETQLRSAVEGFAAHLTPLDTTMVAALPYGGVRVPFTNDPARIRRGIDGIAGQAASRETGSDQACRTRTFLESLETFLPAQRSESQKTSTVVVFTAGMAAPRRDAPMALAPGRCELVIEQFKRITAAASAARASFYVVVPADIRLAGSLSRETIAGSSYLGSDNPLEGIEHFEGATGATRLPLDATGTGSLARLMRESAAYYEAELEPDRGDAYGRSRAFGVRVLRRDVVVRARPEITLRDPALRAAGTKLTVPDLLGSFESIADLPLRVAGFPVREPGGSIRVGVVVEPGDPTATLSSAGALLIAADGRVAGRWFAKDATERPLLGAIAAPPGRYTLRVAAVDAAGRAGIAEDAVDADLVPAGALSLGGLILGVSRPEGLKLQLEFHAEPVAIASFDIYGGTSGQRLGAALEVLRDPDGQPLVSLPLALSRADDSRVTATGAVPLGALPPGDYVIRGVIRLEDGTSGRVMRTLRKVAR